MRQIHQLTQVLVRVIATLAGFKTPGQGREAIEISNKALSEQLDLDVEDLLGMDEDDMLEELEDHPGMNHENLEYIADLFYELGVIVSKEEDPEMDNLDLWQRSLLIYKHIEFEGNVYSIDRNHKISEIEEQLEKG